MTNNDFPFPPLDMIAACAIGDGDTVGLPTVPDDKIENTLIWIRDNVGNDALLMDLLNDSCTECDMHVDDMDDDDEDAHMIVQDFVVIGCEGFHTAGLRYAAAQLH